MSTAPAEIAHLESNKDSEVSPEHTPSRLGRADAVGLALLTLVLLVLSFRQSRQRMFWGDEIMGDYVLRAGSGRRFLELWRAGIDSSGFWFYVFAKPWESVFGASEVALRMFSAVGIATSAALTWITARRFYSVPVVAAAVAVPFLTLYVLRWQLANGRCYGVLMASSAWVIYLMILRATDSRREVSFRFLAATFIAYDVLAGSHILGVVFAGALLAMQIAIDVRTSLLRPRVYGTAAAGIAIIVLPSLQNIRSTTALGKPVFWTAKPLLRSYYFGGSVTLGAVETLIVLLFALSFLHLRRVTRRDPAYILLLGFLLLHCVFLLVSQVSTSIYVDRYLLPFTCGLVMLIAELLTQMSESGSVSAARYNVVFACVCLVPLLWSPRLREFGMPVFNYTDQLLADLPKDLPVVDTDVQNFVEMEFYHHARFGRPFLFPIDDAVGGDVTTPGGVSGFHEMDNFYRLGIDAPDLQRTDEILARYPKFVVVTRDASSSWFRRRIESRRDYEVTDLGVHHYVGVVTLQYWQVQRR